MWVRWIRGKTDRGVVRENKAKGTLSNSKIELYEVILGRQGWVLRYHQYHQ